MRHSLDNPLEMLLKLLAEVVCEMRQQTEQRLLTVLLALLYEFDKQVDYAVAVVEDLREAVAQRRDFAREVHKVFGQTELFPLQERVSEVRE